MKKRKEKTEDEKLYRDFKEKIESVFTPEEIQEMLINSNIYFSRRAKKKKDPK